jgi:hypothetical protein
MPSNVWYSTFFASRLTKFAATAAALLSGAFVPEPGQTIAAVVSGGNVAAKTAAAILNADEA